jgi:hypothetical protein
MESAEPRWQKSSTDKALPTRTVLKSETALPNRAKLRTETLLPILMKSKQLIAELRDTKLLILKLDPRLKKSSTDN